MSSAGKCMRTLTLAFAFAAGASAAGAQQSQPSAVTQSKSDTEVELAAQGRLDGRGAAQKVTAGGWTIGGILGGLVTGPIIPGLLWLSALASEVTIPAEISRQVAEKPEAYRQSFDAGYRDKVRSTRKNATLVGGLFGSATIALIVVAGQP